MQRRTLCLWPGGMLLGFMCFAVQAESWTLTKTLTAAQRYSAEISASKNEAQALDAMADSARELPDPQLRFGIENVPVQGSNGRRLTREGMTMQRVGVMQRYVSEEKRERKAQTLLAQSQSVNAQADAIRAGLQRDTAQAWLDLALSTQALDTARRLVAETRRQIAGQKASVSGGSVPADTVLTLQVTLNAMRDRETLTERDVRLAQTRLMELTGQQLDGISGALPPYQRLPADERVIEEGVILHPEVIAASREATTARARSAQSAIAAIPDVDVELYYARRADGYEDMAGVMFTVDLPLFQGRRQNKDHAADVSMTMQANDRLAQTERTHLAQVRSLIAEYQATRTLWQRQRDETLPLQKQRLSLVTAQYRGGQSALPDLLEARRGVLETEMALNESEKEMARRWAAIRWLIPQEIAL